jgi:DNA-binding MarR family transcriptional regulator
VTAKKSDDKLPGDKAQEHLGFLLSQVGIFASQRFSEAIAEAGIHPPLFRVLNVVDAAEGESQHAIGEAIQVPASRMVAIIDELEQRGLIERRPHPGDRRVRALFLTAKGRKVLEQGRKIAAAHEQKLIEGLTEKEHQELIALLRKLADAQGIPSGVHPGLSNPKPHTSE